MMVPHHAQEQKTLAQPKCSVFQTCEAHKQEFLTNL